MGGSKPVSRRLRERTTLLFLPVLMLPAAGDYAVSLPILAAAGFGPLVNLGCKSH
jgi:hypothetical protein